MSGGLLVFCGKKVGSRLLSFLLDRGDNVELVIPGSSADTAIVEVCQKAKIDYQLIGPALSDRLLSSDRRYDWILSLWNPHVIKPEILALGNRRLNLHPSLVPHARGSDNTAWTIRKDLPAGVSLLDMTEVLDGGGVYAQSAVKLPYPIRASEAHTRLQDATIDLFIRSWPDIAAGKLQPVPQQSGGSFHWRRDTNADRSRDGAELATLQDTVRWMLAHDFHPGTTAEMIVGGERYKLRLDIEKIG